MYHSEKPLFAFYQRMSQSAKVPLIQTPYYQALHIAKDHYPSSIFSPNVNETNVKGVINDIKEKIKTGFPSVITCSPYQTSAATIRALENHCSFRGQWASMSLDLNKIQCTRPNPAIEVKLISTLKEIKIWCSIVEKGLLGGRLMDANAFFEMSKMAQTYFYLAFYNGKPAATALTVIEENEVGIYLIATLEEFRRKGIGRLVTEIPLVEAYRLGNVFAHLQATALGEPVYKQIGFEKLAEVPVFRI